MRKSVVTGWSEVLPLNSLLSTWLSIETQFENIRYVESLLLWDTACDYNIDILRSYQWKIICGKNTITNELKNSFIFTILLGKIAGFTKVH